MRATAVHTSAALFLILTGCGTSPDKYNPVGGSGGSGGGNGGQVRSGGILGSGGAGTGGANQTGGNNATGGLLVTNGNPATGGALVTGGTSATGGVTATGGTSSGGANVTGGTAVASGGVLNAGGTIRTGGLSTTGGVAITGGNTGTGGAVTTDAGTTVAHRFLKSGCDSQSVALVAADGSIEWEYKITNETGDSWLLPNGNVVFAFAKGVREVNPAKTTVWEYLVATGAESHSCQPLDNDQFLIGEARGDGTSYLYEIGRDKKITKTIPIKTTGAAHDLFRQVRKTPTGTYLVTYQRAGAKAEENDATGKLLRSFPCGRYVGIRLPDGNTLIACGDDHRIIEVDAADKIVWEVKETDIPANKLLFVAGLQRLPNGNTVVANWSGHAGDPSQPQIFEITRDKKVVWQVKDAKLNLISSVSILDSDAATNGVLLR